MKHACWLEGLRNKFRCDHVVWRYLDFKIVTDYNDSIFYWGSIIIFESESHSVMSDSLWPHELYSPRNTPGQNTRVGSLSLLQGIFPIQGSNLGLPHYRWILYKLSHQGSYPCLITNWIKPWIRCLWFTFDFSYLHCRVPSCLLLLVKLGPNCLEYPWYHTLN